MPELDQISAATGFGSVQTSRYWPVILAALRAEGIDSEAVQVAAAATLKAELGSNLAPRSEAVPRGADPYTYFETHYGASTSVGRSLGNTKPGDGYKYRGRGFIQLTGASNYRNYGNRISVNLVDNPDAALETYNAARIFAAYFKDRGVATAAENNDWPAVRKLVNGGLNGWEPFKAVVAFFTPTDDSNTGRNILPPPSMGTGIVAVLMGGALLALLAARRFG